MSTKIDICSFPIIVEIDRRINELQKSLESGSYYNQSKDDIGHIKLEISELRKMRVREYQKYYKRFNRKPVDVSYHRGPYRKKPSIILENQPSEA